MVDADVRTKKVDTDVVQLNFEVLKAKYPISVL